MRMPKTVALLGNAPFAADELASYLSRCTGCRVGDVGYPFTLKATGGDGEGFHVVVAPDGACIES